MVQRAQSIAKREDQKTKLQIDNTKPFTEIEYNQLIKQFPFTERTELQLTQLDNYCLFLTSKWFSTIKDHIHFIQTCKRLEFNITKFHYNQLPLNERTRELFPNIQTLFVYSKQDNQFINDQRILAREKAWLRTFISKEEQHHLEEWTGLKCTEILFNSDIDNWSENTSVFNARITEKKQLIFLIEDEDGKKFGYYENAFIPRYNPDKCKTDCNSFEFILQSNGRYSHPMKFDIKKEDYGILLYIESSRWLIVVANLYIRKKNTKDESFYQQNCEGINYNGIKNAILDHKHPEEKSANVLFNPKRIIVIEMKDN